LVVCDRAVFREALHRDLGVAFYDYSVLTIYIFPSY
jgi:hypothetical protein